MAVFMPIGLEKAPKTAQDPLLTVRKWPVNLYRHRVQTRGGGYMSINPQRSTIDVSSIAKELKQPPEPIFENDDFPALWFNLHDPVAMKAAFESLPLYLLFPEKKADGNSHH
jgi:hypothetical protein